MSTIDTVESVRTMIGNMQVECKEQYFIEQMLTRYAALLEAVNRPVTDAHVESACRAICKDKEFDPDERRRYSDGRLIRDYQRNFYPYWSTYETEARAALEAHMASLCEEVGK